MWLQYGLEPTNDFLVSIEYVRRGKTSLRCPYCRGPLTAKKGDVLCHHFAHTEETCRSVADDSRELPTLPLYDRFNLHLSPKQFALLTQLWEKYGIADKTIRDWDEVESLRRFKLNKKGVVQPLKQRGGYQFSDLGKIPFGALPLKEFDVIQDAKISYRHYLLIQRVQSCFRNRLVTLPEALTDLKIYQAQLHRILSLTLYFLQVQADGQMLYKIGVTRRAIEERTAEIEAELRQHFHSVKLKLRGAWEHRGNLELYFKHRYKAFQHPVADLTEYYQFSDADQVKAVLTDLRRVKPKVLSESELAILAGHLSPIEQQIEAERQAYFAQEKEQQRSRSIRVGMSRAKQWGTHVGRPAGASEPAQQFLAKPSSQRVLQALQEQRSASGGYAKRSLRQTAAEAGVSVNTVRKVKALLDRH